MSYDVNPIKEVGDSISTGSNILTLSEHGNKTTVRYIGSKEYLSATTTKDAMYKTLEAFAKDGSERWAMKYLPRLIELVEH